MNKELAKVRQQLMRDHLKALKEAAKAEDDSAKDATPSEDTGSGPVVAAKERLGHGLLNRAVALGRERFTVDLHECTITDDPGADPVVQNIQIAQ